MCEYIPFRPPAAHDTPPNTTHTSTTHSVGPPPPKPDKVVITRVTGPEPGYVATPIIFVEMGAWAIVCGWVDRYDYGTGCLQPPHHCKNLIPLTPPPTPRTLARCLLEQRATLPPPIQAGGVFTPGAIFYSDPMPLINRLRAAGVDFAVVQQG